MWNQSLEESLSISSFKQIGWQNVQITINWSFYLPGTCPGTNIFPCRSLQTNLPLSIPRFFLPPGVAVCLCVWLLMSILNFSLPPTLSRSRAIYFELVVYLKEARPNSEVMSSAWWWPSAKAFLAREKIESGRGGRKKWKTKRNKERRECKKQKK